MPDNAVSLTVVYENIPNDGSSSSDGGSGLTNPSKDEAEVKKTEEAVTIDKKPIVTLTSQVANYIDVPKNAWYYDAVSLVTRRGIFKGTPENTFAPNTLMTRGMFVTVLANLEGVNLSAYNKAIFSDVESSDWFANQVAWANGVGIVSGVGDNDFAPNKPITREEMAVMFNNYLKIKNISPFLKMEVT